MAGGDVPPALSEAKAMAGQRKQQEDGENEDKRKGGRGENGEQAGCDKKSAARQYDAPEGLVDVAASLGPI